MRARLRFTLQLWLKYIEEWLYPERTASHCIPETYLCLIKMNPQVNIASIQLQFRELYSHFRLLEDPGLFLWEMVNEYFPFQDPDGQFWWRATGLSLARMLSKAGYSVDSQSQQLLFYRFCVAPELGAGPDAQGKPQCWESFMTDSHTPIEFSWDWGCPKDEPVVRYSIEPISFNAGTPKNPLNDSAADRMIRGLGSIFPNVDLEWFDHFSRTLLTFDHNLVPLPFSATATHVRAGFSLQHLSITRISKEEGRARFDGLGRGLPLSVQTTPTAAPTHKSQSFLAFDVHSDSVTVKAYFIPTLPLQASWNPTVLFITAIQYLGPKFPSLPLLYAYLSTHPIGLSLQPEMLSIDCKSTREGRIKIYFRTRLTSLTSVRSIMTLDDLLMPSDKLELSLREVEQLWSLVLGAKIRHQDDELDVREHRTAGLLYYFEIREDQRLPVVKLYIPVRHYGGGDRAVQEGLGVYLRGRGQGEWFKKFQEAMEGIQYVLSPVCCVPG